MKKIAIIGGGIAGLSTGCYAQMNGFKSEIFEMHSLPGGVCTSWRRDDYLFDHCLHWVIGSNKGTTLYPIFKELGISDNIDFHYTDRFRVITLSDKTMTVYTDIDRFKNELLRLFPDEKKGIDKYTKLIRKYTGFNPPMDGDFGSFGLSGFLKLIPYMASFIKLKGVTIEDFLNKLFKNEELKEMLFRLFPVKELPALMAVMPLSFMHQKEAGYPLGGSLNFAGTIESKYLKLGGQVNYNSRVKKIIVENDAVQGIRLENGDVIPADIVISACDGYSVLFDMLDGKYITKRIKQFYGDPKLWSPIVSISLGVNRDLSHFAEINDYKLDNPIVLGDKKLTWSGFFQYGHDPSFSPKGKSVVQGQFETDYHYWRELYDNNRGQYYLEKERILESYIKTLDKVIPGIAEDIEVTDVATPVTWERYTGNWQGSYEGWVPTVKTFGATLPKKLPGLDNFYMTGQWVYPGGGVPMCMAQGKNLFKLINRDSKRVK